jgi:hypothetical protein
LIIGGDQRGIELGARRRLKAIPLQMSAQIVEW